MIAGPANQETLRFIAPAPGLLATISVVVTDSEGSVVSGQTTFSAISDGFARLLQLLCSLRKIPNFPIDPLSDPLRDRPIDQLSQVDLRAVRELAFELGRVASVLLEEDGAGAGYRRVQVDGALGDPAAAGSRNRASGDLAEALRVNARPDTPKSRAQGGL